MTTEPNHEQEKARRFRDDALLHLDDVFTLAHYLMRNAEDAVQEMLSAGTMPLRQLSRPSNETMAIGDCAKRLPCQICAAREAENID
jgi:hypothetical protein